MPLFWPAERVTQSTAWAARGRAKAPALGPLEITLGAPTFVGDDLEALRAAARQNLVLYTGLPFFQRMFRASGFAEEAALMERGDGMAGLSDRLLEAICLLGPRTGAGSGWRRTVRPGSGCRSCTPRSGSTAPAR